ncbi:McrB family protein [Idiomarina baltica]|nr:AAA family ATPase [Idiomarina baltica]
MMEGNQMTYSSNGFKTFLRNERKSNGEAYSNNTVSQYVSAVNRAAHHAGFDLWSSQSEEVDNFVQKFEPGHEFEEFGAQGNNTVISALRLLKRYFASSNSYLLTWNPEKYHVGGNSGVELGNEQQWSCNSTKPQVGDRVYLMQVGVEPRGIIAAGIVTQESFEDKDWGDETKTRKYIKFKPVAVRNTPEAGQQILNQLNQLSQETGINYSWSPQSSGISIPNKISDKLASYWFIEDSLVEEISMTNNSTTQVSQPLNQILFGPPGTGKTFTTIERAVRAAEPNFSWANRDELKAKYQELIREGRIRFVTFHQSFSYEDFVEGLTAHTDDEKLVYEKRLGIFRQIVRDAKEHQNTEVKNPTNSFSDCWDAFLTEFEDHPEGVQISMKRSKFIITEVDGNTIRFDKNQGDSVNTLSVSTLEAIFNGERRFNGGLKPYYQSLISHLESLGEQLDKKAVKRQNYVLIIDEINRGNISRIFGELITLIEPSKRSGTTEALEVTLPLTGDRFSVPDNLYIIGTMNTADRSLAGLDLALRRRFDFIEMPPLPEELKGVSVDGINVEKMLDVINRRITALLDKDHCIGHAYFIHLKDRSDVALTDLAEIFKQKIIPLLQEYFFEDWQRIRWVLNDQSKASANAFIVKDDAINFDELFPGDVQLNSRDRWRLNESAFEQATSYKRIYEVGSAE